MHGELLAIEEITAAGAVVVPGWGELDDNDTLADLAQDAINTYCDLVDALIEEDEDEPDCTDDCNDYKTMIGIMITMFICVLFGRYIVDCRNAPDRDTAWNAYKSESFRNEKQLNGGGAGAAHDNDKQPLSDGM